MKHRIYLFMLIFNMDRVNEINVISTIPKEDVPWLLGKVKSDFPFRHKKN